MSAEEVIEKSFRTTFSSESSIIKCELYYKEKLLKKFGGG